VPVADATNGVTKPVFSWTGFYIGADGGYAWGNSSGTGANDVGTLPVPYSFNVTGPIAGGFVGGNYQFGQVVVGAEADWQWADLTGSGSLTPPSGLYTYSSNVKDYGSVRARLGYAVDHWLFFGTGGWAFGSWSTSYGFTGGAAPFFTNSASSTNGWTLGGGVEYAFTNYLIARVEYRYPNLGPVTYVDIPSNSSELGNKITINDVRAGLSFKFGGPY
jgi:outer membrane immunogenic protein